VQVERCRVPPVRLADVHFRLPERPAGRAQPTGSNASPDLRGSPTRNNRNPGCYADSRGYSNAHCHAGAGAKLRLVQVVRRVRFNKAGLGRKVRVV